MLNVSYATSTDNVLSVHFCSDYAFSTATRLSATAIPSDDTLSVFFNIYSFGYLCSYLSSLLRCQSLVTVSDKRCYDARMSDGC